MDELERPEVRSRVKGRGALIKRLGGLVIAVHRYGRRRAATADERAWTGRLIDRLQVALDEARGSRQIRRAATEAAADVTVNDRQVGR